MHIEPGVLNAAKIAYANYAAAGAVLSQGRGLWRAPRLVGATLLAAAFFSLFMELYHQPVGPSELHFIGASLVYTIFGFTPTLLGFALGLFLQGVFFEPTDLVHLGVNSLSLIVPLFAADRLIGRRLFIKDDQVPASFSTILRFDAVYYSGVVAMVGFWLALGEEASAFSAWARFALAYVPLILCEPIITACAVKLLKRFEEKPIVAVFTMTRHVSVGQVSVGQISV